eukprot:TRINITY_DN10746_c0_g1_i1.p1 TRINITY_DN10746_c0_g1~~TRINITY_DN10746_c0_g1_i1.p1  ORF type:complete len:493 (+),score=94.08 TRINITY_DN10746_c0_g1_i1:127-1605(+)
MAACHALCPGVQGQQQKVALPLWHVNRSLGRKQTVSPLSSLKFQTSKNVLLLSQSHNNQMPKGRTGVRTRPSNLTPMLARASSNERPADGSPDADSAASRPVLHASSSGKSSLQEGGKLLEKVSLGVRTWLMPVAAAAVILGGAAFTAPAEAADALKTCACLLKGCRGEFVRCLGDVKCAANIACLQACNNRPDETECQIGCGDLFENSVVDAFNACAVTKEGCVPQKPDENLFPVPPPTAVVPTFPVDMFTGTWYITAGLNPTFDTFDCQKHEFRFDNANSRLLAHLEWRVATPDGGFFTKQADQRFIQDPEQPGVLYNHDNEFLHYEDDWYILASQLENKKDDFIYVYYRGKNDAWDGYGGAVVYTRAKTLPASIKPRLQEASRTVNINFDRDFKITNNACGPLPSIFKRLEAKVEQGEQVILADVRAIGKAEAELAAKLKRGLEEVERDEEIFLAELGREERELLGAVEMGAKELGMLFQDALPIRRVR